MRMKYREPLPFLEPIVLLKLLFCGFCLGLGPLSDGYLIKRCRVVSRSTDRVIGDIPN